MRDDSGSMEDLLDWLLRNIRNPMILWSFSRVNIQTGPLVFHIITDDSIECRIGLINQIRRWVGLIVAMTMCLRLCIEWRRWVLSVVVEISHQMVLVRTFDTITWYETIRYRWWLATGHRSTIIHRWAAVDRWEFFCNFSSNIRLIWLYFSSAKGKFLKL